MNYILKPLTNTSYTIQLGRDKVGFVRQTPSGAQAGSWIVSLRGDLQTGFASAKEAFTAAVRRANRIEICGEDNAEKARAALAQQNAEVRREAAQLAEDFRPIIDIAARHGIQLGTSFVKTRKVSI